MQREYRKKFVRYLWWLIAAVNVLMLWAAHTIFQNWLYMQPCEQCVYIRFACAIIALGSFLAGCFIPGSMKQMSASFLAGWGMGYGILKSWTLIGIYKSVRSDSLEDLFGATLCSLQPHYPLGLPFDQWFPSWFAPSGDCGFDRPVPPDGAVLGTWQEYFIELYQSTDGWYLLPQQHWLNMPECALIIFCTMAFLALYLCVEGFRHRFHLAKKER